MGKYLKKVMITFFMGNYVLTFEMRSFVIVVPNFAWSQVQSRSAVTNVAPVGALWGAHRM